MRVVLGCVNVTTLAVLYHKSAKLGAIGHNVLTYLPTRFYAPKTDKYFLYV